MQNSYTVLYFDGKFHAEASAGAGSGGAWVEPSAVLEVATSAAAFDA